MQYATGLGLTCDELLAEQSFTLGTPFKERTEGKRFLEHVEDGDTVLIMMAKWQ